MADSPPDKWADVDVKTLNRYEAAEYRQELMAALGLVPEGYGLLGGEFEEWDEPSRKKYLDKLEEVGAYLKTFPDEAEHDARRATGLKTDTSKWR